jgi:hypothetical protein
MSRALDHERVEQLGIRGVSNVVAMIAEAAVSAIVCILQTNTSPGKAVKVLEASVF